MLMLLYSHFLCIFPILMMGCINNRVFWRLCFAGGRFYQGGLKQWGCIYLGPGLYRYHSCYVYGNDLFLLIRLL